MHPLSLRYPINVLSQSPDGSSVICGGREVLKILSLSDLSETRNLRIGKPNLNYSTQDLSWHPSERDWVLSAAKNSFLVLWNLQKTGSNTIEKLYKEHKTMASRVKWHPTQPDIFISAGLDGFIRLWDRRIDDVSVFAVNCNAEGARDVAFSDKREHLIGASFDSGSVQILDWRKETTLLKIIAHKRSALSVEWHPVWPDRIASAGSDKSIKVWNSVSGEAIFKVQAPEAVARVKWLPGSQNMIVSASHTHDNNIYIWNIEEPVLPDLVFRGHSQPVKDFIFLPSPSPSIVSCSDDGYIIKQPLSNAYSPKKDRPTALMSVSSLNLMAEISPHSSKGLLQFITLGDPRPEIKTNASQFFVHKSIEETCLANSITAGKNSGVWRAVGLLNALNEANSASWIKEMAEESLNETVEYHAEKGELQTSACISNVLGLKGPSRQYAELLRQLELNQMAAKLPISHSNLEFFYKCRCGKPVEDSVCAKCDNAAECSVCGVAVKGLFCWCQGCGHGGHAAHMNAWFRANEGCPSGCGHRCRKLE
jgi:WD40 repeat protein